jgi:hypothetical protein
VRISALGLYPWLNLHLRFGLTARVWGTRFSSSGALVLSLCVCVYFFGSHTWPVIRIIPGAWWLSVSPVGPSVLVDDCVPLKIVRIYDFFTTNTHTNKSNQPGSEV